MTKHDQFLRELDSYELEVELKKRKDFSIIEMLEQIKSVSESYNMGMLTPLETMKQIASISEAKIKQFYSL